MKICKSITLDAMHWDVPKTFTGEEFLEQLKQPIPGLSTPFNPLNDPLLGVDYTRNMLISTWQRVIGFNVIPMNEVKFEFEFRGEIFSINLRETMLPFLASPIKLLYSAKPATRIAVVSRKGIEEFEDIFELGEVYSYLPMDCRMYATEGNGEWSMVTDLQVYFGK